MKKTIDVCDECKAPYLAASVGEKEYCESCAMEKYHIVKISPYRCERCGQSLESRYTFYITKHPIGVYCSLQCAVDAMEEIDNEN